MNVVHVQLQAEESPMPKDARERAVRLLTLQPRKEKAKRFDL